MTCNLRHPMGFRHPLSYAHHMICVSYCLCFIILFVFHHMICVWYLQMRIIGTWYSGATCIKRYQHLNMCISFAHLLVEWPIWFTECKWGAWCVRIAHDSCVIHINDLNHVSWMHIMHLNHIGYTSVNYIGYTSVNHIGWGAWHDSLMWMTHESCVIDTHQWILSDTHQWIISAEVHDLYEWHMIQIIDLNHVCQWCVTESCANWWWNTNNMMCIW